MRLRDRSLRTGSALVRIAAGDRRENRGLLFLVRGAPDAEPLTIVLASRRSGKTSLLRRLEEDLASDCAVVFLDLQRHPSPEDLAASALAQATASSTRVAAERVARDGWAAVLRQALVRTADRRPLVLILDELVYLLQFLRSKPDEAAYRREVVATLRELSGLRDDPGVVLLVAGSRDLADYLREEVGLTSRLPLVADLERFRLSPLGESADDPNLDRVLLGSGLVPEHGDEAWLRENFDLALPWVGLRFLDALVAHLGSVGRLDPAGLDGELVSFLRDSEVFRETDRQLAEGLREPAARAAVIAAVDRLCSQPARAVTSAEDLRALFAAAAPKESERLLAWMIDHLPVRAEAGEVAIASRLFHRWWCLR